MQCFALFLDPASREDCSLRFGYFDSVLRDSSVG